MEKDLFYISLSFICYTFFMLEIGKYDSYNENPQIKYIFFLFAVLFFVVYLFDGTVATQPLFML